MGMLGASRNRSPRASSGRAAIPSLLSSPLSVSVRGESSRLSSLITSPLKIKGPFRFEEIDTESRGQNSLSSEQKGRQILL